jgi:hypothetical protein
MNQNIANWCNKKQQAANSIYSPMSESKPFHVPKIDEYLDNKISRMPYFRRNGRSIQPQPQKM